MPEWDEQGNLIGEAPAKKSPADIFRQSLSTAGSFGHTPQPEEMPQGALGKLGLAGTIASLPLGVQAAGAPLAALKALGLGLAGASAGGYAGRGLGQGLEYMGAPEGTSDVTGTVGGLVGGLAGPVKGPAGLLKLAELGGGRSGMLASLARKALPEAAEGAAGAAAARAETVAAKMAAEEARAAEIHAAKMETAKLRNEILKQRLEGKVPARVPKAKPAPSAAPPSDGATALKDMEPEFIDPSAVKVLPFPPAKGTVKPATNLGGAAKPGPAGTPPDQLEETLRRSIEAAKAKKAGAVVLRPSGYRALGDEGITALDSVKQPGHVYRGMEAAEYEATIGAGKPIGSTGKYSHPSEGTNFAAHPADAESYVNFGRSDPRVTGKPTYLVETKQSPDMTTAADGYLKTQTVVEPTRIWRMEAKNGEIVFSEVRRKAGAVRGKSPIVDEALTNAEGMHQREATAGMTERVAARRKEVGSQVVARELGMKRHDVQSDAGTILNEALGEVSPVIPSARWAEIVTKMKSLPPEERVAYVAKARGVKNMAQIENLRRTLETLGLLLPVGVAASSVDQ